MAQLLGGSEARITGTQENAGRAREKKSKESGKRSGGHITDTEAEVGIAMGQHTSERLSHGIPVKGDTAITNLMGD